MNEAVHYRRQSFAYLLTIVLICLTVCNLQEFRQYARMIAR